MLIGPPAREGLTNVPTYQYACTDCGEQLEVVQKFTDDALTVCPACDGRLRKVFSAVGVVFKGSGFYRTDSRASTNGSSENGAKTGAAATNGARSTESSGSDSSGSSSSSGAASSGSNSTSTSKATSTPAA